MKSCPECGLRYEDDTLVFCLQDGARLSSPSGVDPNATLHIPPAALTQPGPTGFSPQATPAQSTITARPEPFHFPGRQTASEAANERNRSPLPWILAIVAVIGISGILVAWLLTRGRPPEGSQRPSPTPVPGEISGDWQQCETTTGAGTFCGTWTFSNGQGTGQWGTVEANLSINLDGRNITVTRRDRDSSLQARYRGTLSADGREISGQVDWCCDSLGDRSGTWNAKKK